MKQFRPFNKYVCVGDTRSVDIGNVRFEARIEFDEGTRPTDFDCYGEDVIQAWRNDEWFFLWCGHFCLD